MLKKMLSMITDALNKNPNSNIGKIFQVFAQEYKDINDTLLTMQEWTDLNKAEGKVLDAIGDEYNQRRGTADDERYRMLIRAKRARNKVDGTINNIIDALSVALSVPETEISVQNWNEFEPASIVIEIIPKLISEANLNVSDFKSLSEEVVAAGVNTYLTFTITEGKIVLQIKPYHYPVYYPETGEFSGEKNFSQFDTGIIENKDDSYIFEVEYPVSEKMVSIIECKSTSLTDSGYSYAKNYPETGEMTTLNKLASTQESSISINQENYCYRVICPVCGEIETGGEW